MEVIDIGLSDLEPLELNLSGSNGDMGSSAGLGPGIELLMNDKHKTANSGPTSIDLGELDRLENELNELSGHSTGGATNSGSASGGAASGGFFGGLGNMFGMGSKDVKSVSNGTGFATTDSKIGSATAETMGSAKTWDGFTKVSEIPTQSTSSRMTDRDRNRKKRMMIKKLDEWYDKGLLKNRPDFSDSSSYEDVEDEYETAMEDKRKRDAVKLYGWWFTTAVNSMEYANSAFDPFGLNLEGWGESVGEDLDSYDEIFGELYERYKGGKLMPEVSLLLRLGFSAAMVNFTNKALSSATPGFNDVIRQSPELMRAFTNATASAMSQSSPGFAMANGLFNDRNSGGQGPSANMGPPPAPIDPKSMPPPVRPDIAMGRGSMFREPGVDVGNQFQSVNASQSIPTPVPSHPPMRQEMRGPQNSDVENILAGLKPKTVSMIPPPALPVDFDQAPTHMPHLEDDSMISIASLKDMHGASMPKRSNRRGQKTNTGSSKNTISLDI